MQIRPGHYHEFTAILPFTAIPCLAFHSVPRYVKCQYRPYGNSCRGFSFKLAPALPSGLAATTLLPMTTSTTHNTLLLLSADAHVALAPLAGLSEVDELMIALGCRFALDIFTIAQQDRPPPVPVSPPHDPGFVHRRPALHSWSGIHTPNSTPCRQTVHLRCDDCRRAALHRSHSVRIVRPQRLFTPHLAPLLLIFRMFASLSLFCPAWQINCSRPMPSGSRGGITLGILAPLGFQLLPPRPHPLLQPLDFSTTHSLSSASSNSGPTPVPHTQCHRAPLPPPGLEEQTLLRISHNIPSKAVPTRLPSTHGLCSSSPGAQPSSQLPPAPQPHASTTQVGPHPTLSTADQKRSTSTALAGTHLAISAWARAGRGPFPMPMPSILPVLRFGLPKPPGHSCFRNADSDLMRHQLRLSILQWNPGPPRRNPTQIIAATCGRFQAVISQEARDHLHHISDKFNAHTCNTDLAILLNKDTFEPNPAVFAFDEASTSKRYMGHGPTHCSRTLASLSLSQAPTVTFCSVHIHNVVAKKRDASTDLL